MRHILFSTFIFFLTLLSSASLNAQLYSAQSYQLTINGTSSLHDWSSSARNVSVQGDFVLTNGTLEKINSATVLVVTKSIKSDKNSSLMDDRTHETLKADKYPSITYVFSQVKSVQKTGSERTMIIGGILTIGGVSKAADLTLQVKTLPNGNIDISGSRSIIMSQYGIKPPVFMLGALKVSDEVQIKYHVILQKKN